MGKHYFFGSYNSGPIWRYLLDEVPNANIGFDLQKLRSAYSGACIKVLRDSDNTTLDIGFVNNVIDTVSLLSFIGSGTGYVHTWYDQSINGNNATQTVKVNMPRIVNSGVVETLNGKPAIRFMGNQWLLINTINVLSENTRAYIGAKLSTSTSDSLVFTGLNEFVYADMDMILNYQNSTYFVANSKRIIKSNPYNFQQIHYGKGNALSISLKLNGIDSGITPNNQPNSSRFYSIGKYSTNTIINTNGHHQSMIFWNYEHDSSDEIITHDILNGYYNAY